MSFMALAFYACGPETPGGIGLVLGYDGTHGSPALLPNLQEGELADGSQIKLAVKMVQYVSSNGQPVMSQEQVMTVMKEVNQIYSGCKIFFRVNEYIPVEPKNFQLDYNTASLNELDSIRSAFNDPKQFLVVNTGAWNHGSMGSANAWTAMPGNPDYGAIIEAPVAQHAGILAHELGHYLNLDHAGSSENLMSPIIYDRSKILTQSQCTTMRQTAQTLMSFARR